MSPLRVRAGGILDAIRARTAPLHREAERSGFIGEVLRRRACAHGYALLLRNLLPVYVAMERMLDRRRHSPALGALAQPGLYRSDAIRADLRKLQGADWQAELPLLGAGARYAGRIMLAARKDPALLVAHAYTRYLGDLNGGQTLQRLLAAVPGIGPQALSFHAFPRIGDAARFRLEYRCALERCAALAADPPALVEEAVRAFRLNIALSNEVRNATDADRLETRHCG